MAATVLYWGGGVLPSPVLPPMGRLQATAPPISNTTIPKVIPEDRFIVITIAHSTRLSPLLNQAIEVEIIPTT